MPLRHYSEVLTRGESEVVVRELGVGLLWVPNEVRLSWATKHLFAQIWNLWGTLRKSQGEKKAPKRVTKLF